MTIMTKPAFPPLDIDAFDGRLDARAAARGIPTLTRPEAPPVVAMAAESETANAEVVRREGIPAQIGATVKSRTVGRAPSSRSRASEQGRAVASTEAGPTPRARMKPLNVELPDYVWIELKSRAAREMVCVRHVIMTLLQDAGIAIAEADMIEDGRRLR